LDQGKQAELQLVRDPSEINKGNLNNARLEANRNFRNEKMDYLQNKFNELATNSKNRNIRHLHGRVNEFKKGYQLRSTRILKTRMLICLNILIIEGTTSLRY
jgi:hypothetical protein